MLAANTPGYGFYLGPAAGHQPPFPPDDDEEATDIESESDVSRRSDDEASTNMELSDKHTIASASTTLAAAVNDISALMLARCLPKTTQEKLMFNAMFLLVFFVVAAVAVTVTICLGSDICGR